MGRKRREPLTCLQCFEKAVRGDALFCPKCAREKRLKDKEIPKPGGGGRDNRQYGGDRDPGPWYDNGVRCLEDGRD